MIGVGILGAGYWGPKHIRNFGELPGARVALVADLSDARLASVRTQFPDVPTTRDYRDLLTSPDVEAVVVATPVSTHAQFAREALMAGKHVLVEKPLTGSSRESQELITLAAARQRVLMVGHTFLYNPAVRILRDLVQSGELGAIYYAYAQRLNLGLFQRDINVVWDLAPHDLSILMYVLGADPIAIGARGNAYVQPGIEDVAYLDLAFVDGVRAMVHVSWLDPNKVRRITVVGSKKMVVYDDVEPLEKIRVYNKGVDLPAETGTYGTFQLSYRYGDIAIPPVPAVEPLRQECQHFLECIETGATPLTCGLEGLKVVSALEVAQASLRSGGAMLPLSGAAGFEVAGRTNGNGGNGQSVVAEAAQSTWQRLAPSTYRGEGDAAAQ